jgi:hypothetical protein
MPSSADCPESQQPPVPKAHSHPAIHHQWCKQVGSKRVAPHSALNSASPTAAGAPLHAERHLQRRQPACATGQQKRRSRIRQRLTAAVVVCLVRLRPLEQRARTRLSGVHCYCPAATTRRKRTCTPAASTPLHLQTPRPKFRVRTHTRPSLAGRSTSTAGGQAAWGLRRRITARRRRLPEGVTGTRAHERVLHAAPMHRRSGCAADAKQRPASPCAVRRRVAALRRGGGLHVASDLRRPVSAVRRHRWGCSGRMSAPRRPGARAQPHSNRTRAARLCARCNVTGSAARRSALLLRGWRQVRYVATEAHPAG